MKSKCPFHSLPFAIGGSAVVTNDKCKISNIYDISYEEGAFIYKSLIMELYIA